MLKGTYFVFEFSEFSIEEDNTSAILLGYYKDKEIACDSVTLIAEKTRVSWRKPYILVSYIGFGSFLKIEEVQWYKWIEDIDYYYDPDEDDEEQYDCGYYLKCDKPKIGMDRVNWSFYHHNIVSR